MAIFTDDRRAVALLILASFGAAPAAECTSLIATAAAGASGGQRLGDAFSLLRGSPAPQLAQAAAAIRALDTDGSGKVEQREMEAFAEQKGVSASQVAREFQGLDTNGDGDLGPDEIAFALKGQTSTEAKLAGPAAPSAVPVSASAPAALPRAESEGVDVASLAGPTAPSAVPVSASVPAALPRAESEGVDVERPAVAAALTSDDPFQTSALLEEARSEAGKALATVIEKSASSSFDQNGNEEKAAKLDSLAKKLRAQAAAISQSARENVTAAAAAAAEAILLEAEPKMRELQQRATSFESEARERRTKAWQAMDTIQQAQVELRASLDAV